MISTKGMYDGEECICDGNNIRRLNLHIFPYIERTLFRKMKVNRANKSTP